MTYGHGISNSTTWSDRPVGGMSVRRVAVTAVVAALLAGASVGGLRLLEPGPSDGGRADTTAPLGVPPPTTGDPGQTAPGVHVRVVPRPDGDLDVVEEVHFLYSSAGLELALPAHDGVTGQSLPLGMRIADLQASADGRTVDTSSLDLTTGGRLVLPTAPRAVVLRYRLVDAATTSTPSSPGRALVLLPPITADDALAEFPVVVEVSGPSVRNLVCPGLAAGDQLCGRQTPTGWRTVPLPSRDTAVLAQLDLPT